jgi:hypothetical protein
VKHGKGRIGNETTYPLFTADLSVGVGVANLGNDLCYVSFVLFAFRSVSSGQCCWCLVIVHSTLRNICTIQVKTLLQRKTEFYVNHVISDFT